MAPSAQSHSRSHSLLLVQKLLNLRDSASPLTLVLDTIEQSASPLLREFMSRAKVSHTIPSDVVTIAKRRPRYHVRKQYLFLTPRSRSPVMPMSSSKPVTSR